MNLKITDKNITYQLQKRFSKTVPILHNIELLLYTITATITYYNCKLYNKC